MKSYSAINVLGKPSHFFMEKNVEVSNLLETEPPGLPGTVKWRLDEGDNRRTYHCHHVEEAKVVVSELVVYAVAIAAKGRHWCLVVGVAEANEGDEREGRLLRDLLLLLGSTVVRGCCHDGLCKFARSPSVFLLPFFSPPLCSASVPVRPFSTVNSSIYRLNVQIAGMKLMSKIWCAQW
uniref:Uncharacterized protein n=1 Tax=Salix viminalis TaxID=40686 RepID=A0A6N2KEX0_SALVM